MSRVGVLVVAVDALTRIGLAASLHGRAGLTVLPEGSPQPDVVVFAPGESTAAVPADLRASVPDVPTVLVTDHTPDRATLTANRVVAVVPRRCAATELTRWVLAAATDSEPPPHKDRCGPQPVDRVPAELSEREVVVLRMLADGQRAEDIARELACSVRTVRNITYALVRRLNLRNQAHAVAYAVRNGLI